MKLKFSEKEIKNITSRYNFERKNLEEKILKIKQKFDEIGYMDKEQLKLIAKWKSPRSAHNIDKNEDDYVKEIILI